MRMTVDVILQELEIRINKLKDYIYDNGCDIEKNIDLRMYQRIRMQEYESFKNWIEIQIEIEKRRS